MFALVRAASIGATSNISQQRLQRVQHYCVQQYAALHACAIPNESSVIAISCCCIAAICVLGTSDLQLYDTTAAPSMYAITVRQPCARELRAAAAAAVWSARAAAMQCKHDCNQYTFTT
jgi:hypothetical protein